MIIPEPNQSGPQPTKACVLRVDVHMNRESVVAERKKKKRVDGNPAVPCAALYLQVSLAKCECAAVVGMRDR